MKCWKNVLKSRVEKMFIEGDGEGILNALIDERGSTRRKAAEALRFNGLDAFCGLSSDAIQRAYAKTGMLVEEDYSQNEFKNTILRLLFCRALIDLDERVRESLVWALSSIDPTWVEQVLENLKYDRAYTSFSFPPEAIGLLKIPPDPRFGYYTYSARGGYSPEELYLGNRAHGFMRMFKSISSGSEKMRASPEQKNCIKHSDCM